MRAVIFEQFKGPIELRRVPDPALVPGGVILAVRSTGICRSDWHGWQGHDKDVRLPHVPGHELAGEVVEVGAGVTRFSRGDRVTVPFVSGCGGCAPCVRGDPQVCDAQFQPGFTHWGSFAEYVALHYAEQNLVRLPDEMTYESAASLGCRFTTAYRALVQLAELRADETLVVFGCGGVGLSSITIAKALGARAVAVDVSAEKLALARSIGAEHAVDAAHELDVAGRVMELTRGGADVSIDALGSSLTLRQSIDSLRKRGRHVQVGLMVAEGPESPIPMGKVIANELVLFGSHGISARAYPDVFELISRRAIPLDRIIGQRVGLAAVPAQLAGMGRFESLGMTLVDPARQ